MYRCTVHISTFARVSALLAYLDEAIKADVLKSDLSKDELRKILETEGKRPWNIFIGRLVSKRIVVDHIGRYIRRPPIAQSRLTRTRDEELEYLAKDTSYQRLTPDRYLKEAFVATLIPHVRKATNKKRRRPRWPSPLSVVWRASRRRQAAACR